MVQVEKLGFHKISLEVLLPTALLSLVTLVATWVKRLSFASSRCLALWSF